jgi:4-oxalocrotonate tautomerase
LVVDKKEGIVSPLSDIKEHTGKYSDKKLQEKQMPYVNIRVAGKLSKEQKQNISKGVTDVIAREANKPPESILIFIDEVPHENIAKAGKLLQEPR